jgi:hypothetical protein
MAAGSEIADFILVHSAWFGGWCWNKLVPEAHPGTARLPPGTRGPPASERKWATEETTYDITIVLSNLPKADTSSRQCSFKPAASSDDS